MVPAAITLGLIATALSKLEWLHYASDLFENACFDIQAFNKLSFHFSHYKDGSWKMNRMRRGECIEFSASVYFFKDKINCLIKGSTRIDDWFQS